MIKTIAKILLAIAILWTLAFVFKLGNSFALTPEYKKEITEGCIEDSKGHLGIKRAKQYCTCTVEMLGFKYLDQDILSIGVRSEEDQLKIYSYATEHCNKNANASNKKIKSFKKITITCSNTENDEILLVHLLDGEVFLDIEKKGKFFIYYWTEDKIIADKQGMKGIADSNTIRWELTDVRRVVSIDRRSGRMKIQGSNIEINSQSNYDCKKTENKF